MSTDAINKKIVRKNITIAVLTLALGISIYFHFFYSGSTYSPKFRQRIPNKTSRSAIKHYRDTWSGSVYKKTRVVWYDTADVRKYITDTLPDLIAQMQPIDATKYKWVVGFYFMRKDNGNGDPRNSFYVVPTVATLDDSSIIDFFDHPEWYATKRSPDKGRTDSLAFDAGHIWP